MTSIPRLPLAAALLLAVPAAGLAAAPRTVPPPGPSLTDFAGLTGTRPQACAAPPDTALSALGAPSLRRCAWSGRLELVVWQPVTAPAGACLPAPAIAWQHLATIPGAPPWNGAWTGRARLAGDATLRQAAAVWKDAAGAWSAALWRWRPAARPATRDWEAARWQRIEAAARTLDVQPDPAPAPLLQAWLDATAGRPRALDGDAWRWVSQGACLQLRTAGLGQARLPLPWSRDDARLEQRTAMQVQLARRLPDAEWLQPFTLLDPFRPERRTGAKFVAVWKDGAAVRGQLWMPLKDGGIVRARVETSVAPAGDARRAGERVEAELGALARAWEVRHE